LRERENLTRQIVPRGHPPARARDAISRTSWRARDMRVQHMMKTHVMRRGLWAAGLVAVVHLASVAPAAPSAKAESDQSLTSDRVMSSLNQTLAWYREARVAMRAVGTIFAREDKQTALGVLHQAFETARAEAAFLALGDALGNDNGGNTPEADTGPMAAKRATVQAALEADEQEPTRLRQQLRTAPHATPAALPD